MLKKEEEILKRSTKKKDTPCDREKEKRGTGIESRTLSRSDGSTGFGNRGDPVDQQAPVKMYSF